MAKNDLSDWGDPGQAEGNGDSKWRLTREKVLMFSGLALIAASFLNSELRGGTFHFEYVLAGLALCGISITGWTDRR